MIASYIRPVKLDRLRASMYVLTGSYQSINGEVRNVNITGTHLWNCIRQLVAQDCSFAIDPTEVRLMGGHIVPDYDVSDSACTIGRVM